VAALLAAAAGLSAIVVAIQMRPARGRSSSQNGFAVEDEGRSGSNRSSVRAPSEQHRSSSTQHRPQNAAAGVLKVRNHVRPDHARTR
jgi:hypothetical protein